MCLSIVVHTNTYKSRKPPVFSVKLKLKKKRRKYTVRYRANIPDCEATIEKARKLGIKVRPGGGRPTRGGEPSEWGQFVLDMENVDCTVEINIKSGIIQFSYTSVPKLEESVQVLEQCYVTKNGQFNLTCEGFTDPLDRAFEFTTIENWKGTGVNYFEARVELHQWFDPETGEYIFRLPDREGRVIHPGTHYIYQGYCPIHILTIDKDDDKGNRIITGERVRWQAIQELKRIAREHPRFKPEKKG